MNNAPSMKQLHTPLKWFLMLVISIYKILNSFNPFVDKGLTLFYFEKSTQEGGCFFMFHLVN